jgi:HEPN domain-containing protein
MRSIRQMNEDEGLRERLTRQGEEAVGRIADDLLGNPIFSGALTRAFEAREKAIQAQQMAMGALNLPSASDIERLTRRLRSVSQRLEGIEDAVQRLEDRLATSGQDLPDRLRRIEEQIASLTSELAALGRRLPEASLQVPRDQERLAVPQGSH